MLKEDYNAIASDYCDRLRDLKNRDNITKVQQHILADLVVQQLLVELDMEHIVLTLQAMNLAYYQTHDDIELISEINTNNQS